MSLEKLLDKIKNRKPREVFDSQLAKFCDGQQSTLAEILGIDTPPVSNLFTYINQVSERLKITALLTDTDISELEECIGDKDRLIKEKDQAFNALVKQMAEELNKKRGR